MPANAAGRRAVITLHNQDGQITLFALSHESFATKRLALSTQDVVHAGNVYKAFNFEVEYPTDDKGIPTGRVRVSNVTKEVWDLVRGISTPPQIDLVWVLESDTETVQDEWQLFDVSRITASALALEGEFNHELYANEPYPAREMRGSWANWMNYF